MQVRFSQPADDSDLRSALGGASAPPITRFGADNEFVIRASIDEGGPDIDEVAAGIWWPRISRRPSARQRSRSCAGNRSEPRSARNSSARPRSAIFFSLVLTLIYIGFRFEFRFGLAAVIATAHDMLVVLGLLALTRVEISLPTVAAILTILGYSLNDTIVVFDRIRENLNAKGGRREDPYRLVNRSINETLPRTVLTSGTTLGVLFALLVLGGAVIRDFTIVLILGVAIGTYSSIFIASPALLEIQKRFGTADSREKARKSGAAAAV